MRLAVLRIVAGNLLLFLAGSLFVYLCRSTSIHLLKAGWSAVAQYPQVLILLYTGLWAQSPGRERGRLPSFLSPPGELSSLPSRFGA